MNNYIKIDYIPDTAEPVDVLFRDHGKSLRADHHDLPQRPAEDIMTF